MSERITGTAPDDVFDTLTADTSRSSQPDPRTNAGAREIATRTVQRTREAQPYADAIETTIREHVSRPTEAGPDDAYRNLSSLSAANQRIEREDAQLRSVEEAFRSRPDVEFYNDEARDQVRAIWAKLGGKPADLENAYRIWLKKAYADLASSTKKPADVRTARGALAAAAAVRGPRTEWEARHRTVREAQGPMTKRDALTTALKNIERAKTAR